MAEKKFYVIDKDGRHSYTVTGSELHVGNTQAFIYVKDEQKNVAIIVSESIGAIVEAEKFADLSS